MQGTGCDRCNGTGYKGRVGLYEVMEVTDELRELVLVGASALELRRKAVDEGMLSLRTERTPEDPGRRHHGRRSRSRDGEVGVRSPTARRAGGRPPSRRLASGASRFRNWPAGPVTSSSIFRGFGRFLGGGACRVRYPRSVWRLQERDSCRLCPNC